VTHTLSLPPAKPTPRVVTGLNGLVSDAMVVLGVLFNPGRAIREVEAMRALQVEADRVEAKDPARAAMLRQRASRIGLD